MAVSIVELQKVSGFLNWELLSQPLGQIFKVFSKHLAVSPLSLWQYIKMLQTYVKELCRIELIFDPVLIPA